MSDPKVRVAFAHTLPGRGPEHWQVLRDHLDAVADLAASFASAFGAAEWGRLAGLWHDLGKYRLRFQEYLHGRGQGVEHSIAGAVLAQRTKGDDGAWLPLAFVIAGHHAGLTNLEKHEVGLTPLRPRLVDRNVDNLLSAEVSARRRRRGLKLIGDGEDAQDGRSYPARGRGLKLRVPRRGRESTPRRPRAGAWIETDVEDDLARQPHGPPPGGVD